jgi:hypothetical protein
MDGARIRCEIGMLYRIDRRKYSVSTRQYHSAFSIMEIEQE